MIHSKDGSPMKVGPHPALAQGKVRYVGDHVAIVVAETKAQAKAAEVAGVSRAEFISALSRFNVSPFQYDSPDELIGEIRSESIDAWGSKPQATTSKPAEADSIAIDGSLHKPDIHGSESAQVVGKGPCYETAAPTSLVAILWSLGLRLATPRRPRSHPTRPPQLLFLFPPSAQPWRLGRAA
jgi:hypothetical protein